MIIPISHTKSASKILMLALSVARIVVGGRIRLNVCPESFHLAWQDLPPYTETINSTAEGILFRTFEAGMRACCIQRPNEPAAPFVLSTIGVNQLMVNETRAQHVQFVLPVQRSKKARGYLGHPFVPIIPSPGFALFVKPRGNSFDILLGALKPVFPMFIISMLAMAIAGVVFWIMETIATVWEGETPEPFHPGVWNGVWWSFITMTTIGYGDVTPKTKPGKTFAVIWVLAGIVLSGVVVSTIASVLIDALSPKVVKLMNQNVAVLHDTEEARYSFKNQGITYEFTNVSDIAKALETDVVRMAVVDVLLADSHHDMFKEFVLDRIIEQEPNRGVVFLPGGVKFSSCFQEYILNHQREIIDTVSKIVKGSKYKSYRPVSPSSIIDPTVPAVQYALLGTLGLIFFLISCGLFKEWLVACRVSSTKTSDTDNEVRLLKECKEMYLYAGIEFLEALMKDLHTELENLRQSDERWKHEASSPPE